MIYSTKVFFISGFVFLLSCNLWGQNFNAGIQAGLSTSEISGDYVTGPSNAGAYRGLFTNMYISDRSILQLELNYVQKGSKKNPDSTDVTSYLLRMHYIEIHFLYKLRIMKLFNLDLERFVFEVGPSLGYLAKSYEEIDGWIMEDNFNSLDFSGSIGMYYFISDNLAFNIRYSNTLFFPVRDVPSGDTYFLRKGQFNEVLSFTFHYTIFGKGK